ncbi:MAG TPA: right-handed parallel beta-helix repeat-containing protein [Candidatus Methylacidiphilales bacterium]|nr:right-handed parallel beta-helix repeat-containing protein [Candidatus Methylacidiphilales bacterium]
MRRLRMALSFFVVFIPVLAFANALYTEPNPAFIEKPGGDNVIIVKDSSGSIATVQASIDTARRTNPAAILRIDLNGNYLVTTKPLTLTSHECLILSRDTIIRAVASSTAGSLISINGQTNVSIAGGILDAAGRNMNCISVTACNRVNIDGVRAENAGLDGIFMTGNGNTAFDNELTAARCTITGCAAGHYGINVQNATQTALVDDISNNNAGGGIFLGATNSTIVHCTCDFNDTGISVDGKDNAITENVISGNGTGIGTTRGSATNMILSNQIQGSKSIGLVLAGAGNVVFDDTFNGNVKAYSSAASGNFVVALGAPLDDKTNDYFYPPTVGNPHTFPTIVRGMGRTDLTVQSTTVEDLQTQYENARKANPNDVIVLHLPGTYTATNSSFQIHSDTCVLLTGTIQLSSSVIAAHQVIESADNKTTDCYISGGMIDGGGHGAKIKGINFSSYALIGIDQVTIRNFGNGLHHANSATGIHLLTGSGITPAFIKGCIIHNIGGRGIDLQNNHKSGRGVITGNFIDTCAFDGYDGDSSTSNAVVQFNTIGTFISRYGIFFEEGGKYNKAIGNKISHAAIGINCYAFNGNGTNWNTGICNTIDSCTRGIRTGSQPNKETSHNMMFDNTIMHSGSAGIKAEKVGNSVQNYFSQTSLSGNATNYDDISNAVFFNSPGPGQ